MNSRSKGARGERGWRDFLRENGLTARRGQQFSGSPDSPDVVCEELGKYHFEVKFVQRLNIDDAVVQAVGDCGTKTPVVAHRKNNGKWLVTMLADDWIKLVREAL